jgi:hypothetical protein
MQPRRYLQSVIEKLPGSSGTFLGTQAAKELEPRTRAVAVCAEHVVASAHLVAGADLALELDDVG